MGNARAAEAARIVAGKARQEQQVKIEQAAREERQKALAEAQATEAKAPEAALAKVAQSKLQFAALLPGDAKLGQDTSNASQSASCAGLPIQGVSLAPDAVRALSQSEECGLRPKDVFRECRELSRNGDGSRRRSPDGLQTG